MRKILGLIISMGQVIKDNITDYWSTDPTVSTPFIFTLIETVLNLFGKSGILVTTASKHKMHGGCSK
jgi:hypothetical protein